MGSFRSAAFTFVSAAHAAVLQTDTHSLIQVEVNVDVKVAFEDDSTKAGSVHAGHESQTGPMHGAMSGNQSPDKCAAFASGQVKSSVRSYMCTQERADGRVCVGQNNEHGLCVFKKHINAGCCTVYDRSFCQASGAYPNECYVSGDFVARDFSGNNCSDSKRIHACCGSYLPAGCRHSKFPKLSANSDFRFQITK